MSHSKYWNAVSTWQRKRLWVLNWMFKRQNDGRELQQIGATFWTVLRSILKHVIFAFILAAALVSLDWKLPLPQLPVTEGSPASITAAKPKSTTPLNTVRLWAPPLLAPQSSQPNWDVFKPITGPFDWRTCIAKPIGLPTAQTRSVPIKVEKHQIKTLLAKLSFKSDSVLSVLSTLAQVSAAMLGLYFAAVSLVVSTSYNKVPGEVRALFVREQVGSHYFSFLAQFSANALLLLLAHTIGLPVGIWCISCILFLAIFGVFSFVSLGLRTFDFFDPAKLVWSLNPTIIRSFNAVTVGGFRWGDPSFQAFHRKNGRFYLYCYDSLIGLADQSTSSKGDSLKILANNLLGVLRHYSCIKCRIPSNSHWFQRVPKHKNWFTSYYSGLEVARATDTGLQPELVPDYSWFEQDAAELLAQIVHVLAARGDYRSVNAVLTNSIIYLEELGGTFKIQEALRLSRAFGRELDLLIEKIPKDTKSEVGLEQCALYVSLFDVQGLGLISILLGLSKTLRETQPEAESNAVAQVKWASSTTLYRTGDRPRTVLEQWETLRDNLDFEVKVGGAIVSPPWIQVECTAFGYAQALSGIVELLNECDQSTRNRMNSHFKAGDFIGTAQIGLRALETTNKFITHLKPAKDWYDRCHKLDRSHDRKWPSIDWADLDKRVLELRKMIIKQLADCVPQLGSITDMRYLPDLFGQVYDAFSARCFEALLAEDLVEFTDLYPKFFDAAFLAHARILKQESGRERGLFKLAMGPLGDLMGLSGYAILTKEATGKDFQSVVVVRWDAYMNQKAKEIPSKMGDLILMFEAGTDILAGMSPRETLRFDWKRGFAAFLESKGFRVGRGYFGEEPTSNATPTLAAFISSSDYYDSEVVFMATYLFKRPEATGLNIPHKISEFWRSVDRRTTDDDNGEDAE